MRCDVCGNDYDKAFQVTRDGRTMTFDAFECAIHAMAPRCGHCECIIIGQALRPTTRSTAVRAARARKANAACKIARKG